eukprot:11168452-Lingulodinium_polyedra.AAC.1
MSDRIAKHCEVHRARPQRQRVLFERFRTFGGPARGFPGPNSPCQPRQRVHLGRARGGPPGGLAIW